MMLIMQETLITIKGVQDRISHARFAVEALGIKFDSMNSKDRNVTLLSDTAIYEKGEDSIGIVYDLGIRGKIESISYLHAV